MEECSVLIIANEKQYPDRNIGIYQKQFDHRQKKHADIYLEFCQKYLKEFESFILPSMIGTDCADLLSRFGHLSYISYLDIIELYIPSLDQLSPIQKTWLKENYHTLNENFNVDICIWIKKANFRMLKKYSSTIVKTGVIEELKELIPEEKEKIDHGKK